MQRPDEGGQALVEFALVIPVFLLLMFAIIQLGLLFGAQNELTNAVRETARYAVPYRVVDDTGATLTCATVAGNLTTVLNASPLTADPSNNRTFPTVTYNWVADGNGDGKYYVTVTVHAEYKFPLYVPLVSTILDGFDGVTDSNLRIKAQETMRVENDPLASSETTVTCS